MQRDEENYNQHMTVGTLKGSNLPKVISGSLNEEWQKRIAGDYLSVNFLFGINVKAELKDQNLLTWTLNVSSGKLNIKIDIEFSDMRKIITDSECNGNDKLENIVKAQFVNSSNIYDFVEQMLCIMHDLST